jgi:hypothetical protein
VLEKAKAQGLPGYLEIFQEQTVAFYRRSGFTGVYTDSLPKGGPAFWCMERAP